MRNAAWVDPSVSEAVAIRPRVEQPPFRFPSLLASQPDSLAKGRAATVTVSFAMHAILLLTIIVAPLLVEQVLPAPADGIRAFFVTPPNVAPPPPPPPPPAPSAHAVTRPKVEPRSTEPARFVAPIDVPSEVKSETTFDLGVEGGVPGGVEGGVPGGVIGGVVGGLPEAPPPPKFVRVGGAVVAPKIVHMVRPEYPDLAKTAHVSALIILEAQVDTAGHVIGVKVLRGAPLFDEPAMQAVKQWRYMPLLLNGEPTPFVLTVTVQFQLTGPAEAH
jgi:protein TonB